MSETPYAETEVLLAVMNNDIETAMKILSDFSPTELYTFANQLTELKYLVNRYRGHVQVLTD